VKEEFPRPQWIVIQPVRLGIRADMSIDKVDLTPFDITITVPQVDLSLPQGFDLGPKQGDPGLVRLFDKVVMKCFFVLTNQLFHLSLFYSKAGLKSMVPPHPPPLRGCVVI
jgi:hypothetical protein